MLTMLTKLAALLQRRWAPAFPLPACGERVRVRGITDAAGGAPPSVLPDISPTRGEIDSWSRPVPL